MTEGTHLPHRRRSKTRRVDGVWENKVEVQGRWESEGVREENRRSRDWDTFVKRYLSECWTWILTG